MGIPPKWYLMSKKTSQLLPNFYPKFNSKKQKVFSLFKICLFMPSIDILFSKLTIKASPSNPPSPKVIKNTKQTPTPHRLHINYTNVTPKFF
jgi:hypothetical protein